MPTPQTSAAAAAAASSAYALPATSSSRKEGAQEAQNAPAPTGAAGAAAARHAHLEDLPRVLRLAIRVSASANKAVFLLVSALAASPAFFLFAAVTQNVLMGAILCGLCFASYSMQMALPNLRDPRNALFLDILAEHPKDAVQNVKANALGNTIIWCLVINPIVAAFLVVPTLGEGKGGMHLASDATLWAIEIATGCVAQFVFNCMGAMSFLVVDVQKEWCRKIQAYLSFVRDSLVEAPALMVSAAAAEDGRAGVQVRDSVMRRIADAQQHYEAWARQCNGALSTMNTFMLAVTFMWVFVPVILLAAASASGTNDDDVRAVQVAVLLAVSAFFVAMFLLLLGAITKPSSAWSVAKRSLLNDARVRDAPFKLTQHDQFEAWLAEHELNAMRGVAGIKISVEKLRAAGGFVASLFVLCMYFILREDLQQALGA